MSAHQSREQRIYLALWRKALSSEVKFLVPSKAASISARQGLYRAIRPYREGKNFDADLLKAAETLVVINSRDPVDEDGNYQIKIAPRMSLDYLNLEALGLTEDDLLTFEEKDQLDRVKSMSIAPAHNPFGNLRED